MTQKAAIIGGGVIGGGWAARFLLMGWDVSVYDPDPDCERKIGEVLNAARAALPTLYDHALPSEGSITYASTLSEALDGALWVQESVPERIEIKHKVIAEALPLLAEGALFCSSTSGFKPSELAEGAPDPSRIIVAHPFVPVYLLPVVELVGPRAATDAAAPVLDSIGMAPIAIEKEIDAHVADRLLEAVWREALWLVKDDIATTEQIDEIMRLGFGLRWAQMGLFETYRLGGGEEGMRHFLEQFGPCLTWPWTKLMDVPELDDALIEKIANQSDAQSGHVPIRELERHRDENLVAMMRALKARGRGVGAHLAKIDRRLQPAYTTDQAPLRSLDRVVPIDWTDYNGHMNESRYGQVFSDAGDSILIAAGAGPDYVETGGSYFTVDIEIAFKAETLAGQRITCDSWVTLAEGKKVAMYHEMRGEDGTLMATGEQLLIHVDLATRRSSAPPAPLAEAFAAMAGAHAPIMPEGAGLRHKT